VHSLGKPGRHLWRRPAIGLHGMSMHPGINARTASTLGLRSCALPGAWAVASLRKPRVHHRQLAVARRPHLHSAAWTRPRFCLYWGHSTPDDHCDRCLTRLGVKARSP
jgi:hypothetical protein